MTRRSENKKASFLELDVSQNKGQASRIMKGFKDSVLFAGRHNTLLYRKIKVLQEADMLPETDIALIKKRTAREIIQNAIRHSPFYKYLYSSIDLEGSFDNGFVKLPVLTRADIRNNVKAMPTVSLKLLKAAKTSGTSGSPLTVYRSPGSVLTENAYNWLFRMTHGLNIGEPAISLRGVLDRHTTHYYNRAENVLYISSYLLSEDKITDFYKLISEFRPKALFAYPSTAYNLITLLDNSSLQLSIPLIFTSSETLYEFQRDKIEKNTGGRIYDYYGNVERTIALGQCAFGNYHEMPLYSINEFRHDGVITTSLINKSFPIIRYFIDDHFVATDTKCLCGKTSGIKKIDGRADDVIRSVDGTMTTGLSLSFRGVNGLLYAQVVQKELSGISVNIVTDKTFTKNDENILLKQLRDRVSNTLQIRINKVNESEIIKSPSGKFKLVVSTL